MKNFKIAVKLILILGVILSGMVVCFGLIYYSTTNLILAFSLVNNNAIEIIWSIIKMIVGIVILCYLIDLIITLFIFTKEKETEQ